MLKAAKFYVGLIAAVAASLLTVFAPDSTTAHVLTIIVLAAGAIGVYVTPNAPTTPVAQPAAHSPTD